VALFALLLFLIGVFLLPHRELSPTTDLIRLD